MSDVPAGTWADRRDGKALLVAAHRDGQGAFDPKARQGEDNTVVFASVVR